MPQSRSQPGSVSSADWRSLRWAVFGILLIGTAAFANSFAGEFVFDDIQEIENNPKLRDLFPPWKAMFGRVALPARPLPYYTFAIDRAIWHTWAPGYHLSNLVLHLGSALLVFGIVRRTLLHPLLAARFGSIAVLMAFFTAAIWVAHPIQTQAVTYVYQRIELLMAFFFFLGFYCFLRSCESPQPKRWLRGSVASMAVAICCKESAVALPPLVLLYDYVFVTGSWRETFRARSRYYLALVATFVLLIGILAVQSKSYIEFREPRSPIAYALNQPIVILHYLRLCFYPTEQCLYSLRPTTDDPAQIIPPLAIIIGCVAAMTVGIVRRRPWGFLLAAFFVPLGPTSSIIPVRDLVMEHRMYIPLVSVALAAVLVGVWVYRFLLAHDCSVGLARLGIFSCGAAMIFVLIVATHRRNSVYYDRVVMWEDVISKAPDNYYAYENLAAAHLRMGDYQLTVPSALHAIELAPDRFRGHFILGTALLGLGQRDEAILHLAKAVEETTQVSTAYVNLGVAVRPNDPERAEELFAAALRINPDDVEALANMALSKARQADYHEAERLLRKAIAIAPEDARLRERLEVVLGDLREGS